MYPPKKPAKKAHTQVGDTPSGTMYPAMVVKNIQKIPAINMPATGGITRR